MLIYALWIFGALAALVAVLVLCAHTTPTPTPGEHVAYTPQDYTGDGVETDFLIVNPYVRESHIEAFVDGVEVTAITIVSSGTEVRFDSAPADESAIQIRRVTPTAPVVTWINGAGFDEDDLNDSFNQLLYITEEGTFHNDNLARVYSQKSDGAQAVAPSVIDDIIGCTALTIPGADGVKKYRVNFLVQLSASTIAEIDLHVGTTGTKADAIENSFLHGEENSNGDKVAIGSSGYEITPDAGDKVGLAVVTDTGGATIQNSAAYTTFLEVVEIREA